MVLPRTDPEGAVVPGDEEPWPGGGITSRAPARCPPTGWATLFTQAAHRFRVVVAAGALHRGPGPGRRAGRAGVPP